MKLLWWQHGRVGAERKEGRKILLELKEGERKKRREERETPTTKQNNAKIVKIK